MKSHATTNSDTRFVNVQVVALDHSNYRQLYYSPDYEGGFWIKIVSADETLPETVKWKRINDPRDKHFLLASACVTPTGICYAGITKDRRLYTMFYDEEGDSYTEWMLREEASVLGFIHSLSIVAQPNGDIRYIVLDARGPRSRIFDANGHGKTWSPIGC